VGASRLRVKLKAKIQSSLLPYPKITSYSNYDLLMIYNPNALKVVVIIIIIICCCFYANKNVNNHLPK